MTEDFTHHNPPDTVLHSNSITISILGKRERRISPSALPARATISNAEVGNTGLTLDGIPTRDENGVLFSTNQIKKLRRQKRFEESKDVRKQKRKEDSKRKRQRAKALNTVNINSEPRVQETHNLNVIIDVGFDDKMTEKEIVSLGQQIYRVYAACKTAEHIFPVAITSFQGQLKERMDGPLTGNHNRWKGPISFHEVDYLQLYPKEKIVYLTADSPNKIDDLKNDGSVYIIGGIVDKNRYKNLCLEKAIKQGIQHAQLPISEYVQLASRKVLTVNHVVEIMHQQLKHKNWEKAFLEVIPKRKFELETSRAKRRRKRQEMIDQGNDKVSGQDQNEDQERRIY